MVNTHLLVLDLGKDTVFTPEVSVHLDVHLPNENVKGRIANVYNSDRTDLERTFLILFY